MKRQSPDIAGGFGFVLRCNIWNTPGSHDLLRVSMYAEATVHACSAIFDCLYTHAAGMYDSRP
jgi:hypothetical protein